MLNDVNEILRFPLQKMNFNIGGPSFSYNSSSSSDSSEFDEFLINDIEAMDREENIAINLFLNNNRLLPI